MNAKPTFFNRLICAIGLSVSLSMIAPPWVDGQERDKLRVSTLFIGSSLLPFWIAQEQGLFARNGVDVELIWMQSTPSTTALLANEVETVFGTPQTIFAAFAAKNPPPLVTIAAWGSASERSLRFYQEVFGGELGRSRGFNDKDKQSNRPVQVGDFGFDLFVQDPKDPPHPSARFFHFAFSIRPDEIDQALQWLKKLGIPYEGPKVHGGSTSISIYFSDPDGYQIEFTAKFPDAETHRKELARLESTYGGVGSENYGWQPE